MDVMCGYFDRWFKALNFTTPVILLAHSFGSFISAHFTMRCDPSLVKMLIFVDPWGVHRGSHKNYKQTTLTNKFLLYLFYSHRPLSLLRSSGPIGPYLMRKSRPDLANNWKDFLGNVKIMHDYIYHCNALEPPMGEELFKVCCHYDVAATEPLQDVMPTHWSKEIPIGFIFGETSCYDATEPKALADLMGKDGFTVAVDTVPNAGHQVFSDNVTEFNERAYNMIQNIELLLR
ncbi:abhydrolase domain-containing protein 4 [Strigomonas culicis]|nr:abhydrolase domain-containing protein 4 [Strigomonas culicis]|eukprot:EPY29583.1 abhydrolase domain-containing protein 4 [Strigomonas culicis]